MEFTEDEWELICAAYSYEIDSDPFISDFEFDERCKQLAETGTNIPNFDPNTGIWVYSLLIPYKEEILERLCKIRNTLL